MNIVTSHTIAKGLLKLLADLMINVTYGDDATSYWQNSFIKWHCWVSRNICATWNCNDYFCRGRGTLKRICFTVGWNHWCTEHESAHRYSSYMKEKGSMTISFSLSLTLVLEVKSNLIWYWWLCGVSHTLETCYGMKGPDRNTARMTQWRKERVCTRIPICTDICYWPAVCFLVMTQHWREK